MADAPVSVPDPRQVQEDEYRFPYHYVPGIDGRRVIYALSIDWAADYLSSLELVRSRLRDVPVSRVCDFGCGDGRLINELGPEFPAVRFVGLELSERALAFARLFGKGGNVTFRSSVGDLASERHELVTCIEVFEHIPPKDADAFLQAAWRQVAPGGTLLLTVPHANVPVHAKHFRHFTGVGLESALRQGIGGDIASLSLGYLGRVERGLDRLLSKLARNRLVTIEPLFQWRLRRRLRPEYLREAAAARIVATITRAR